MLCAAMTQTSESFLCRERLHLEAGQLSMKRHSIVPCRLTTTEVLFESCPTGPSLWQLIFLHQSTIKEWKSLQNLHTNFHIRMLSDTQKEQGA
jgi:hypothetical protein